MPMLGKMHKAIKIAMYIKNATHSSSIIINSVKSGRLYVQHSTSENLGWCLDEFCLEHPIKFLAKLTNERINATVVKHINTTCRKAIFISTQT